MSPVSGTRSLPEVEVVVAESSAGHSSWGQREPPVPVAMGPRASGGEQLARGLPVVTYGLLVLVSFVSLGSVSLPCAGTEVQVVLY